VTALKLEQVVKRFGETVALREVDLEVQPGELLSVLGPSGCGKTTMLRIVAGFERADGGALYVGGERLDAVPASKRNMGMVFQSYSLFPTMTVEQNVAYGLRIRGIGKRERIDKAHQVLDLVRLGELADRYPHELSGGQQQRVALARALAFEPRVLLLDEPLSALDAKVRVQVREEIRRVQTRLGITTLYVTHDQEEALSVSDRVAVMSVGAIEQVGTPAEIYRDPATPFVAEFVGTMNRLDGRVAAADAVAVGGNGMHVPVASHAVAQGTDVFVLIRPESVTVRRVDGDAARDGEISGRVQSHTFLGAVTRVAVDTDAGVLLADVASAHALTLPLEAPVALAIDGAGVRVLPAAHA
jgi:putative spermidine/putrescine transport system ATP-binding protein